MKRLILGSLSVLLMSAVTTPITMAEVIPQNSKQMDNTMKYDVRRTEAFNLVSSAYRGEFEEQGIPSYYQFIVDYESGQITAEDIVKKAIEAGELSPRALEDEGYVNAVDLHLQALAQSN